MKKIAFSLILIFSGFVAFGANQVANWAALPTNAAVVVINGKNVTKADFFTQAKLWAALFTCCGKNMTAEKAYEAVEKNKDKLVDSYIFLEMVNGMTNSDDIVITPQQRATLEARYVRNFAKGQKKTFSNLIQSVKSKGVESEFRARFDADLKYEAYFHGNYSNEYAVTEQDIDKQFAYVKRYNEIVARTNACTEAIAGKIISEARAGADFAKLAKKWSFADNNDNGYDLGDCTSDDFKSEKPEYWDTVSHLKPGEVSDLLKTEEGYEIVKNIGTNGYTTADGIHLARIFLRRAMILPDLPRDEMRDELESARMERARKKAQIVIRKQNSLKFPYGKKIFQTWKVKESKK